MSPLSRRALLGSAAAVGAGSALGVLPGSVRRAMASSAAASSLSSVKHVVILMQENRSFDHYFGTLGGVRGYCDTAVLRFPNSSDVWHQMTKGPSGGKLLTPWHLDTSKTDAQQVNDLDHSWSGTHTAWNNALYNDWIPAKTGFTMGYYTRSDIPFQYALADAFTLCDQYHCSVMGPTNPNRLYQWTGMIDPNGIGGGPVTSNSEPGFTWTTYAESLQNAGVSWRVYQEADNYDDNPLAWFKQFQSASTSSALYQRGMARVSDIASAISADIAAGTFPQVSWVVAPSTQSEHPTYAPALGAQFVGNVLSAIAGDQATWDSTVVFLNYDENDGFYDHAAPPTAPSGTADEYISGKPIGLGPRVPMTVISPWSTGGHVCSQVFDHTSPLQFVEQWLGVQCSYISAWRREVCGNLLSAFDFSSTVTAFPSLPDTSAIVAAYQSQTKLPAPTVPSTSPTKLPTVEAGDRPARGLGYVFDTTSWTDTSTNRIWFKTVSNGTLGGGFTAYTVNFRTYAAWQYTCAAGSSISDYFSAYTYGGGPYDIDLHGPDGYLRGFKGNVLTWTNASSAHPEAYVVDNKDGATLALTLTNAGSVSTTFTIGANAAYLAPSGNPGTVTVAAGGSYTTTLNATTAGRYDFTVTASTGDGFARRFAGRLYAQA